MEDIMLKLENVSKIYRYGEIGSTTLKEEIKRIGAKISKKEDPTRKIGATKRTGEKFYAVKNVSFEVKKGEAVGLIGLNGAGKSTILKLITRVTSPTEGKIYLNGKVASMLEVGTGFHPELTGRENVYLNGAILGMTKKEIDEKLNSIIEFSEIADFIDTPVKRYSSGMYVKLAFSVAVHLNSEIVIMDEVLAVGDIAFQRKCISKMREIASNGKTVIYVSHNMNTIKQLCDRCLVLRNGELVFNGNVDEGISLYLNGQTCEGQVKFDYGDYVRKENNSPLVIKELELKDKKVPVYFESDFLKATVKLSLKKSVENVFLRLTFRANNDIGVGTSLSKPFSLKGESDTEVDFSLSLKGIKQGDYYVSVGIYGKNKANEIFVLDHITRAFKIKINPKENEKITWSVNELGFVGLEDSEISVK